MTGITLVLIWAFPWPAMNDASSHIATAVIWERLVAGDPSFTDHYLFSPAPIPYWSVTWALGALLKVMDPLSAFRVLVSLYAIGLPMGFWMVVRRTAPENAPLCAVAALAVFNWAYWLGEAPFFCGQPLVLIGYALFLDARQARSSAFGGVLVCGVLLYFTHVFALTALVAVLGIRCAASLAARWVPIFEPLRLSRAQWAAALAMLGLLVVAAWFIFFQHGSDANQGRWVFDWALYRLEHVAVLPFHHPGHGLRFVIIAATLAMGVILVWPNRSAWRSAVNLEMMLPALALLLLAYPGPAGVTDEYGLEDIGQRFTLCAVLFGLGAIRLTTTRGYRVALAVVIVAFGALKLGGTWHVLSDHDGQAREFESTILGGIPDGAHVLPLLTYEPDDVEHLMHRYGNFVVTHRGGYSPHVFARSGQQPLRHRSREEYRSLTDLKITDDEWESFDWILVQTDADRPNIEGLRERAVRTARGAGFSLYRVKERR